jgi:hypothetical protein
MRAPRRRCLASLQLTPTRFAITVDGRRSGRSARSSFARLAKEPLMPSVVAYHHVKDSKAWLASQNRKKFFGPLGVTGIREFVDPQNPTRVAVYMEVPDMDKVMAAMGTPAAAEAMAQDGVLPETMVIMLGA